MDHVTPRPLGPRERDTVPIVQEVGLTPEPAWTIVENIAPAGFRTPDRLARSLVTVTFTLSRPTFKPGPPVLEAVVLHCRQ